MSQDDSWERDYVTGLLLLGGSSDRPTGEHETTRTTPVSSCRLVARVRSGPTARSSDRRRRRRRRQ